MTTPNTTSTDTTVHPSASPTARTARLARIGCLVGAALAAAAVPVMGDPLRATSGAGVTDALVASAGRLQLAAVVAMLAGAALLLAAARIGQRLPGTAGRLATAAGSAVAVLLTAYYSAYAAGAVVATLVLDTATAGLGESALVLANLVEMTRYAPGLVLVLAAVAARRFLPRPVVWAAGVLVVLTVLPFTSWVAAMLVPVWLGITGAVSDRTPMS